MAVFFVLVSLLALIIAQPPADDIDLVPMLAAGLDPIYLPGSDEVYNLARYWTWYDWINHENTQNVPAIPGRLWTTGHRVAIDVVPMPEDADGGQRFHLWIFRYRIPNRMRMPGHRSRMTRLREWAFGPRRPLSWIDRIVQEGPFIIQPANLQEDAIALISGPVQPLWVAEWLGRPLMGFRVRQVGTIYQLNRGVIGSVWLRHPNDNHALSYIIANGIDFAIHAGLDVTDQSGRTIVVRIYSMTPDAWVHTGHDTRRIPAEGPWRVRCASARDVILLRPAANQVEWVIKALGKEHSGDPRPLRDFEIVPREPDMDPGTHVFSHMQPRGDYIAVVGPQGSVDEHAMVAVRSYKTQCLKVNTEYFFQNTHIVGEEYVTAVGVVRTYYGGVEALIEEDDGLAPHPDGLAMAESIEVREPGRDRPIAQTQHTNHLVFTFETPEPQTGLMQFLLLCAYAGGQDLKLGYDKLPLS